MSSPRSETAPPADWDLSPAPETVKVRIDPESRLYIDGAFAPAADGRTFETMDPATETPLSQVADAGQPDIDRAVDAARRAFKEWSRTPPIERAKVLYRIARRIQDRARELAVLETLDGGKPIRESRDFDVPLVAQHFFHHAGWCAKLAHAVPGRDPAPRSRSMAPTWNTTFR